MEDLVGLILISEMKQEVVLRKEIEESVELFYIITLYLRK